MPLASAVGGAAAVERIEPMLAALPVPWLKELAEPVAVGVVVFAIAFLSLVIGELVPKSLALRHAEALALMVARPVDWLSRTARFAVAILTASTGLVLRLLGQKASTGNPFHTIEDVRAMLDEADAQGVLDGQVVKGAVAFQDCEARHLMTPRNRVVSIPRGASIEEALRVVRESGYSRFPVAALGLDALDGVVYARVVTLEDIFEAIVGEIRDEHDEPEREVTVLRDDLLEVDGGVAVRELNSRYGLSLPESNDYVTVAGLLLGRLGSVPTGGESIDVEPYRLSIKAMTGRRIARVRIEAVGTPQPA